MHRLSRGRRRRIAANLAEIARPGRRILERAQVCARRAHPRGGDARSSGWRGEPDCIGMASRIASPMREGCRAGTLSFFHPNTQEVRHAGDLQHPDHGRVLRLAAGHQAAVRRPPGEAGVPARRGRADQRGGLPRAPAGQGPRRTRSRSIRASCRARCRPPVPATSIRPTTISSASRCRSRSIARPACANCSTRWPSRRCPACRS